MTIAKARKDPRAANPQDAKSLDYLQGLGSTLVDIPPKCDQAEKALAQEAEQEQQAEVQHRASVDRALLVAGVIFAGAVTVESAILVRQGLATQPAPVQNNYFGDGRRGHDNEITAGDDSMKLPVLTGQPERSAPLVALKA